MNEESFLEKHRRLLEFCHEPKKIGEIAEELNISRAKLMDVTRELILAELLQSAGPMSYRTTRKALNLL
jgi:hypothetical protein